MRMSMSSSMTHLLPAIATPTATVFAVNVQQHEHYRCGSRLLVMRVKVIRAGVPDRR